MERLVMRDVTMQGIKGEALRLCREEVGLSQAMLAQRMEDFGAAELNTQTAVSRAERSFETFVRPHTAGCLIKALDGGF